MDDIMKPTELAKTVFQKRQWELFFDANKADDVKEAFSVFQEDVHNFAWEFVKDKNDSEEIRTLQRTMNDYFINNETSVEDEHGPSRNIQYNPVAYEQFVAMYHDYMNDVLKNKTLNIKGRMKYLITENHPDYEKLDDPNEVQVLDSEYNFPVGDPNSLWHEYNWKKQGDRAKMESVMEEDMLFEASKNGNYANIKNHIITFGWNV